MGVEQSNMLQTKGEKGMETNLKKLISILGITCLSASLIAADDYASTNTQQPATGFPPAVLKSGDDAPMWFVGASYTLWLPNQGGLALGAPVSLNQSTGTIPGDPSNNTGHAAYPEFQLRSGFKVNAGANVRYDGWDVQAEYTWFRHTDKNMNVAQATSNAAQPVTYATTSGVTLANGALFGAWNLEFNRLDATLGRDFYVGHYVTTRPAIGFLGAFESQKFERMLAGAGTVNAKTAGSGQTVTTDVTSAVEQYRNDQKWWGFGPHFTMDNSFIFIRDFSIFMDWGLALPWTKTDSTTYSWVPNPTDPTKMLTRNNPNTTYAIQPMVEMAMGLRWDSTWGDGDSWGFRLQAGWETQTWFNHSSVNSGPFGPNQMNNNLTLQGLTIKARVNF